LGDWGRGGGLGVNLVVGEEKIGWMGLRLRMR
jgi:hypothetical protein